MLIEFEEILFNKGYKYIAGIDEVGRGPLAGPMVVSAVMLDLERIFSLLRDEVYRNNDVSDLDFIKYCNSIKDSKKLTEKKRTELNNFILQESISYSIEEIKNSDLDLKGISKSFQDAAFNCIMKLGTKPEHILIDAFRIQKITSEGQSNIVGGDNKSISIAAASIIGKVYRDNLMNEAHIKYPEYGFSKNKGYGTKEHIEALHKFGPCEIHRESFEPVRGILLKTKNGSYH